MNINLILYKKQISCYKLSQMSGIPYSTLFNICSGKTNIKKISLETAIKLSNALNIKLDDVLYLQDNSDDDVFRSNVSHELNRLGDLEFFIKYVSSDEVRILYDSRCYFRAFYLFATIDYISHKYDIPLIREYNYIRKNKFESRVYPLSEIVALRINKDEEEDLSEFIPEFLAFNIMEKDLYGSV